MNLTSVKYQDSYINIGIGSSQGERDGKTLLDRLRSVYSVYKNIAFNNFVQDTILIRKRDMTESDGVLTLNLKF